MEAMWSRFHPAEQALRALLRSGAIGEPLLVEARLTFKANEVRGMGRRAAAIGERPASCAAQWGRRIP